jgi:hypothetical protein
VTLSGESSAPPPRRRYAIEWDEPGAGFIVDLFDGGKPVINFSVNTDWTEAWHPEVNPAGLQALHAIIDTADPARLARAEAEVERLLALTEPIPDSMVEGVVVPEPDREDPMAVVNEQAEDEGLWFVAQTMPEAYLQQELRRLHAAVEASRSGADGVDE